MPDTFRCMEIRGGIRAVEQAFDTPGLDGWVYSRPHGGDEAGGDVHYISRCGGGVITRLVLADVSGHGASASGFSENLRALMRRHINTKKQTSLVRSLNRQFAEMAASQCFATAVVATYLTTDRSLTVCNAGHPRPVWFRASTRSWSILDPHTDAAGNLPLGLDEDSPYSQFSVPLEPGDAVLFFTDAVTETPDSSGKLLGEDGLLSLLHDLPPSSPDLLGSHLLSSLRSRRPTSDPDDDLTLISLSHNASGPPRMSLGEKLDVYAKVFGLRSYG